MDPGRLLADYMAEQGEGGQSAGLFGHTLVHLVQKVLSREGGTVGLDLYLTQSDSECALSNLKKRRLYLELRSIGRCLYYICKCTCIIEHYNIYKDSRLSKTSRVGTVMSSITSRRQDSIIL